MTKEEKRAVNGLVTGLRLLTGNCTDCGAKVPEWAPTHKSGQRCIRCYVWSTYPIVKTEETAI